MPESFALDLYKAYRDAALVRAGTKKIANVWSSGQLKRIQNAVKESSEIPEPMSLVVTEKECNNFVQVTSDNSVEVRSDNHQKRSSSKSQRTQATISVSYDGRARTHEAIFLP